jgi:hypothetical protein
MNAAEWSNRLDDELATFVDAGEQVSHAYANGSAAGVLIDLSADDDYGRRLFSWDGKMGVRFNEQKGWWQACWSV